MKGIVIIEMGYESTDNALYDFLPNKKIKRTIIPELDNLAITIDENKIYLQPDFDLEKRKHTKLKEIEVPKELINMITELLIAREKIKMDFAELIK